MSRLYVQLKGLCRTFNNGQRITGFIPTQVNKAGRAAAETNDGEYSLRAINQYSEIPNSSDFVFYTFRDQTLMDNNECVMGCLKARRCERPKKFRATFAGATGIIASILAASDSSPASGGMNANVSGWAL
jgi:hypothetical protein